MTSPLTTRRDLIEHVFEQKAGQDLAGWVADQFDEDPDLSWRELERRLEDRTDGLLPVSRVSLKSWFGTDTRRAA